MLLASMYLSFWRKMHGRSILHPRRAAGYGWGAIDSSWAFNGAMDTGL